MAGGDGRRDPQRDPVGHYKAMLTAGQPSGGFEGLAAAQPGEPDLSDGGIRDRVSVTGTTLHQVVKVYLGDRPDLHDIADRLTASGDVALRVLRDGDGQRLRTDPEILGGLEAIVRTDGSRPSFMIRDGEVDRSTSPLGSWSAALDDSADLLRDAITCVGRIDLPGARQRFVGTGFRIGRDLICTNRHVLQLAATQEDGGAWAFEPGAAIDFGHEYRARESVDRRALRRVVFSGAGTIALSGPIDHAKLDLALIELDGSDSAGPAARPPTVLGVDVAPDWPQPELVMYTIGYPGAPAYGTYTPSLLERLFQSTFGFKRFAPGLIIGAQSDVHTWTTAHDATTLGGNSGSVVLVAGREGVAAGLHYGGSGSEPRENWGHVLGLALDETDGHSGVTLRERLAEHDVRLVDRTSG